MIEIISENVSLALQAAKNLDEIFLERISNLSPTDQKIQIKRMKILATRDHRLDFGSDYRDIHLQLAFNTYVDSIEFWNRLLIPGKSKK